MKNKTIAIIIIVLFVFSKILEATGSSSSSLLSLLGLVELAILIFLIITSVRLWKEGKVLFIIFFLSMIIGFIFDVLFMTGKVIDGNSVIIINSLATLANISVLILIIIKLFNKQGIQSLDNSEKKKLIYENKGLSTGAIWGIIVGVIILTFILHFLLDTCPPNSPLSSLCLEVDL